MFRVKTFIPESETINGDIDTLVEIFNLYLLAPIISFQLKEIFVVDNVMLFAGE
jgi:hypothetical protein